MPAPARPLNGSDISSNFLATESVLQEFPGLCKQPEWEVAPDKIDWEASIAEVLERGKDVPEVEWCLPGEANARKV